MTPLIGIINGITTAILLGLLLTFTKICMNEVSFTFFTLILMGGTNFILLIILLISGKKNVILEVGRRNYELYLVGIFSALLNFMGNWGLALSSPLNAGILQRSDLLFSLLIGYLLWKQKLKKLELLGMLTMIVGIFFVLNINLHDLQAGSIGDVLLLASAFLLAVNAEIIKHRLDRVEDIFIAFFNSGICTLFFLIFTVSSHSWPNRPISLSIKGLLVICILISVLQFFTYYKSLRELPTWLVRVLCLGIPVVALLSSASLFHQKISLGQIGGMCLLAAGIILIASVQRSASRRIPSID